MRVHPFEMWAETSGLHGLEQADRRPLCAILLAHELVRKPVPFPDQVEDKLFGITRWPDP